VSTSVLDAILPYSETLSQVVAVGNGCVRLHPFDGGKTKAPFQRMAGIATAAHWQIAGNGSQDQLHLFRTLRIEGVTVVARRITTRGTLVVKSKRPSASVFAEARSPICSTQASGIGVPPGSTTNPETCCNSSSKRRSC